jgi:hypothetical protein
MCHGVASAIGGIRADTHGMSFSPAGMTCPDTPRATRSSIPTSHLTKRISEPPSIKVLPLLDGGPSIESFIYQGADAYNVIP